MERKVKTTSDSKPENIVSRQKSPVRTATKSILCNISLSNNRNTYENIQKSINGFNENIEKLKTEKVSPEELECAKKALKTTMLNIIESGHGQTADLFFSVGTPYGVDYVNKQFEIIDQITPDDIYNTARYVFKSKPIYSITATKDSLEYNKDFLQGLENSK